MTFKFVSTYGADFKKTLSEMTSCYANEDGLVCISFGHNAFGFLVVKFGDSAIELMILHTIDEINLAMVFMSSSRYF